MLLVLASSQYAGIADASQTGLDIVGDITIEFWVKLTQLPSTAGSTFTFIAKGKFDNTVDAYLFSISSGDDEMDFFYIDGSDNRTKISCTGYTFGAGDVGTWRHIAVAVDVSAKTASFYVDGVSKTTTVQESAAAAIRNSGEAFNVGATTTPGLYADFRIDELRIWDDIRTQSEIDDNKCTHSGFTAGSNNLIDLWHFDGDLTSLSGNNNLTGVNTPTFLPDIPDCLAVSASLSPSLSPSISPSKSPSKSPSVSPSVSLSPSISPSVSPSISPSVSPSVSISPSLSPSVSLSPSISISISPSLSPLDWTPKSKNETPDFKLKSKDTVDWTPKSKDTTNWTPKPKLNI